MRNKGIDALRIMSAFAVILVHINALKFFDYKNPPSGMNYWIESIFNLITRFSVPCFIMISGALLLSNNNNKNFKNFYKKSCKSIVLPYIIALVCYTLGFFIKNVMIHGDIKGFLGGAIQFSYGNLWFMPMIIGLYLMVPILIRVKDSLNFNVFTNLTILLVIWACISAITSSYRVPYSIGVVFSYLSYFLLGYVLFQQRTLEKIEKITYGGAIVILLIATVIVRSRGFNIYERQPYIAFFSPVVVVYSCYLFRLMQSIKIKINLTKLSELTYFVYLVHTAVYLGVNKIISDFNFHSDIFEIIINFVISSIIIFIIAWISNIGYLYILKKLDFKIAR